MVKKMIRAKVLTLSLVLAGMNTMYLVPQVSASGVDVTTPVTAENVTSAGYNSIKVSGATSSVGIQGGGTSFTVTMSGDRLIEATCNNTTTMASASGILGSLGDGVKLSGDGTIKINVKATAGTGTYASAFAYGLDVAGVGTKIIVNGDVAIKTEAAGGTNVITSSGYAYGSQADRGTITVTGNVDIEAAGTVQLAGQMFRSVSLAAYGDLTGVGTNDFSAIGKTKILKGDMEAITYGVNKLVLDTPESYLQGNIVSGRWDEQAPYGTNNITIANGATWRPVYDNRYGTDCVGIEEQDAATKNVATLKVAERATNEGVNITLNKDGVIDLTWDGWNNGEYATDRVYRSTENNSFRKLTIAKLAGSDGIVKVDSDLAQNRADLLTIGSASTATSLKVKINYDDFYKNSVKGDNITGKAVVLGRKNSGNGTT